MTSILLSVPLCVTLDFDYCSASDSEPGLDSIVNFNFSPTLNFDRGFGLDYATGHHGVLVECRSRSRSDLDEGRKNASV
ncbi:hypothetical protein EVAR_24506_1 [Eumeta japonica]|uniref:Uncharacterized protein n=1 Tax=Eumeta variegata TaxID=151549 RepID=A0A4C1URI9_EUMVA|nr:hypothetical protein EVAR_24506_1 [Eumeta japonica]